MPGTLTINADNVNVGIATGRNANAAGVYGGRGGHGGRGGRGGRGRVAGYRDMMRPPVQNSSAAQYAETAAATHQRKKMDEVPVAPPQGEHPHPQQQQPPVQRDMGAGNRGRGRGRGGRGGRARELQVRPDTSQAPGDSRRPVPPEVPERGRALTSVNAKQTKAAPPVHHIVPVKPSLRNASLAGSPTRNSSVGPNHSVASSRDASPAGGRSAPDYYGPERSRNGHLPSAGSSQSATPQNRSRETSVQPSSIAASRTASPSGPGTRSSSRNALPTERLSGRGSITAAHERQVADIEAKLAQVQREGQEARYDLGRQSHANNGLWSGNLERDPTVSAPRVFNPRAGLTDGRVRRTRIATSHAPAGHSQDAKRISLQ